MPLNWAPPDPDEEYLGLRAKRDSGEWEVYARRSYGGPWFIQAVWTERAPDGKLLGYSVFSPSRSTPEKVREWVAEHYPKAYESWESVRRQSPGWPTPIPAENGDTDE